jgi:hypothetical protein
VVTNDKVAEWEEYLGSQTVNTYNKIYTETLQLIYIYQGSQMKKGNEQARVLRMWVEGWKQPISDLWMHLHSTYY